MSSENLDLLVSQAITAAEIAGNRKPSGNLPGSLFSGVRVQERQAKSPDWTAEEERFIVEHLAAMSDAEIGVALGRTPVAIRVHREREMNLPSRSKSPGIFTLNKASKMLGLSSCHALSFWLESGIFPGYRLPGGGMARLVTLEDLTRWVCTPANWVYLDIDQIRDERLYRMAHKRLSLWGDEWWSNVQVAEYHGIDTREVQRHIKNGYLKAVQPPCSIGGRAPDRAWKLWRVLRSDAIALTVRTRANRSQFTPAGEAWILRAHDELDMSFGSIARTMNPAHPRPGRKLATEGAVYGRYWKLKGQA